MPFPHGPVPRLAHDPLHRHHLHHHRVHHHHVQRGLTGADAAPRRPQAD